MQNIDLDLPDSPQHLHQLHPQGKECAGNRRTDPRSRLDDRRERRTDGNAAATVPDDQSIGTTGQVRFVLLYLEEKSYEEIAEITGLTVTNVATTA